MTILRAIPWPALGLATALLLGLEAAMSAPRARYVLAAYAGALAVMAWLRRRQLMTGPMARPIQVGFAASVLACAALVPLGGEDARSQAVFLIYATLSGWIVLLALLSETDAPPEAASPTWTPGTGTSIAFLGGAFVLLAVTHWLAVGEYALVSDEVVFLTQSRWIDLPQLTKPMDAEIAQFFRMRKVDYLNGHLYGMYPPGWPAILAAFRGIGLEWWSSIILGTYSIAVMYQVGRRLQGSLVGAIAAALLATSQFFLVGHAGYMSHAAVIAALLTALWLLLDGIRFEGWRRAACWIGAGAMFGIAVTVRPLTALGVGGSIGIWMLARAWVTAPRLAFLMAMCVAIGGAIPAVFFITYNLRVFGEPLALGHSVMHPGMYSLGFGQRGFFTLDQNLNWSGNGFPFAPIDGVRSLVRRIVAINTTFVPVGLLLPICAAAVAARHRFNWKLVATFSILPALLFFYWSDNLRQYAELLPFVLLAVAAMLVSISVKWPRLAWGLGLSVVLANGVVALPWAPRRFTPHRPWSNSDYRDGSSGRRATLVAADSLARAEGPLLLFAQENSRFDNLIDRLYFFNGGSFNGPIVAARDRGPLNAELIARYPGRTAYLVKDLGGRTVATFTRLTLSDTAARSKPAP